MARHDEHAIRCGKSKIIESLFVWWCRESIRLRHELVNELAMGDETGRFGDVERRRDYSACQHLDK